MAGPPAKALGPDGLVKNISRQTCNMLWFLIVSNENTVVIRKGGGNHSKCDWQAQIYNRALSLSLCCWFPPFDAKIYFSWSRVAWVTVDGLTRCASNCHSVNQHLLVFEPKGRPVARTGSKWRQLHLKWNVQYSDRFLLHATVHRANLGLILLD